MDKNKKTTGKLGKGLGALLGENQYSVLAANSSARIKSDNNSYIRIDSIETNPGQPRSDFDEEALQELAQSIKVYGLIQPITVRPVENGKYQLISGERRLRASKLAGLKEIPAFVRTVDEMQSIQMALVENIQREDLNAIEIAVSYKRLIDECNFNQDELSAKVGKNKTTIINYLRLLKLSEEVQIAVRDNKISMGHARSIVGIDNPEIQNKMLHDILTQGLSVRQTESIAKKYTEDIKPLKKVTVKLADNIITFKTNLSSQLNTKVAINKDVTGKGKISISFKSDEELAQIITLLSK